MSSGQQQGSSRGGSGRRWPRRRLVALAALPALAILAVALMAATMVTHLAQPSRHTLVVAAIPYWNAQRGTAVVLANSKDVNEASPWIYGLSAAGTIVPQYPPGQAATIAADISKLRTAHMLIVPSLANVTGGNWDYHVIARILHSPTLLRQHVKAIVALVQRQNYAGIDIDYEELQSRDRHVFTQFSTELAAALHAHGKVLSVAVFPQTTAPARGQSDFSQDYAALGKVADQVRIMGYNFHWETSPPGATAPIGWVRSVLTYAISRMPASKVVLGIPLFGYDWPHRKPAAVVSWLQARRLSRQHHSAASYDNARQAPYFSYTKGGRTHIVWFENAESSRAKFQAVKGDGVAGVYLWMYGYEDPGTWASLGAVLPTSGPSASSSSVAVP